MATNSTKVLLQPRSEDWDDLMELLEDLKLYATDDASALYPVIQAIAEGRETTIAIKSDAIKEFIAHMREFKIDATAAK